ncbi:unnamed protein product [Rotaria socialis]|uniref:Iron hydrogenase large subunit C-terminal domain-containing protein n=2 Tax=Rotaria socialis TaxID=392032 RepID=A0A821LMX9_9BILA|nr:unnamed protein product [Rotaria socialis]CAF3348197.1 unnamed protein product [Rotaria socialis]CAF4383502.1 unnamed protein product [Rotaria socialis]CAF4753549.1 unnamed protein product [Rotaria socialis]
MLTKNFSGALQLTDLDDFIGPSQQCIIPMQTKLADNIDDGLIKLRSKKSNKTDEESQPRVAKITLNDCLACSGCITSAESILIDQQDYHEAQRSLQHNQTLDQNDPNRKVTVISISPQSLSSVAVKYKLDGLTCARRITSFLKLKLKIDHVYDISYARNFALIEMKNEFIKRFRNNRENLPLLTSECPGWICYAEKTQGEYIIPYISRVKSPQQILGSFIKRNKNENIYHISIQPCFDKKLEASRQDFYDEQRQQYDVDCVIATAEFDKWLTEEQFDPQSNSDLDYDEPYCMKDEYGQMILTHRGSGSGGYLDYIFRCAAKELFNIDMDSAPLEFKATKNQDFRETLLTVDGQIQLRFAYAYGFRNIQNIVQKLKRNKCEYDFVEIMACPSGCINGGGQIRNSDTNLDDVRRTYETLPYLSQPLDLRLDDKNHIPLFTEYRPIEKNLLNTFNLKW